MFSVAMSSSAAASGHHTVGIRHHRRDQDEGISGSADCFLALTVALCSCLHRPRGPVASTATSMIRSGTSHWRNNRKRKSRTATNAKMEPATGPQWALSLRSRRSRGSTSSPDTRSYTWGGKRHDCRTGKQLSTKLPQLCLHALE